MRLIDADKFKEYIESGVELAFFQEPLKAKKVEKMADAIIADIDAQPTVEARLKSDMAAMIDKIRAEIIQVAAEETKEDPKWALGLKYSIKIIDKHTAESEEA